MMAQLPITLPKASMVPSDEPPKKLIVRFDKMNNYFIQINDQAEQPIAYTDLPPRLIALAKDSPEEVVTVCADPDSIYDRVVDLMALVGTAGFYKVALCP
jgi:biopolymer transport protein ExbD